ncbi:trace amine-associated receptor 13c-like [Erpetoichthys calabaricus]|uniref:trace amine-associated receptor 13c-like n=1 Tax=Erpetoichthys calabaricus TaxID=27687 RepID=UPI00109F2FF4|nr:trace amine-associated receptor 13c-like [Erpetoichthys calabaricus]
MNFTEVQNDEPLQYCFQSENISCPKEVRTKVAYAALYCFFSTAILVTVGGNLVVIISISHFKQLRTPTNLLVLSLAVADLFLGLFSMPLVMVRSVETCWFFGSTVCIMYSFVDVVLCAVSVFHLVFIAIDRYHAVCDPMHYPSKITVSTVWMFIAIGWIIPILYSSGLLYFRGNSDGIEVYNLCPGDCMILLNALWGLLDTLFTFCLPFSVMISLYSKIFIVARQHARAIHHLVHQKLTGERKRNAENQKIDNKATKTLGIVVSVFILCWSPYCFNNLFTSVSDVSSSPLVVDIFGWLAYFNSAFNPIIYGLFYPWFRKALKLILTFKILQHDSSLINLFPEK